MDRSFWIPKDTFESAEEKRRQYVTGLKLKDKAKSGWHFLVGEPENVNKLMNQIGFHYIEDKGEFAHSAAIMLLTHDGEISQYFTGIDFRPFDVKLALVEASKGKVGSIIDHVLLFCFRFDPTKGRYTWAAFNIMRLGGILTFLCLGALIFRLWRRERLAHV